MVKVNGAGGCAEMRPHLSDGRGYNCTRKMDTCGLGHNASICDPALRTYNREAECKGPDDWYQFSPWRAPGSAPVWDACGMAGGHPAPATHRFGAMYYNTSLAKQGDVGSKLPRRNTGVVWRRASSVQVSWSIEANHGGGYQVCAPPRPPFPSLPYRKAKKAPGCPVPAVQGRLESGRGLLPAARPALYRLDLSALGRAKRVPRERDQQLRHGLRAEGRAGGQPLQRHYGRAEGLDLGAESGAQHSSASRASACMQGDLFRWASG